MPMTLWRRYGNRYAFSAFRSFEQLQVVTSVSPPCSIKNEDTPGTQVKELRCAPHVDWSCRLT
jgi:hypothetical protein